MKNNKFDISIEMEKNINLPKQDDFHIFAALADISEKFDKLGMDQGAEISLKLLKILSEENKNVR